MSRLLSSLILLCLLWVAPLAKADPARLSHLLQMDRLFGVLQEEGVSYGADLYRDLLDRPADSGWTAEVRAIHAPDRLLPRFESRFADALTGADRDGIEGWLDSPLGRRIVSLEIDTRAALLVPGAEEEAIRQAETAAAARDPRLAAVRRVIDAADLIEANVAGGMNANLAFYRALVRGGAFPDAIPQAEMLADVAAQEDGIRRDVTQWLEGYLFRAYAPLSIADIDRLAGFSASAPGQSLIRAEFVAFDVISEETSAALGAAIARRLAASDL